MGEKFGHDVVWENHLVQELEQTELTLDVVLEEQTLSLKKILSLAPGDQLVLRRTKETPVLLRCGDRTLFEARIGQRQGQIAVKIEDVIVPNRGADSTQSYS